MHEKPLRFGCTHENQTIFLKKMKIYFWIFFEILFYFSKFWRKPGIFNTGSVFYSVSLQPDIIQNSWKNMRGTRKYFKMPLGKFEFFSSLFIYIYKLGWTQPSHPARLKRVQPTAHMIVGPTQRPCLLFGHCMQNHAITTILWRGGEGGLSDQRRKGVGGVLGGAGKSDV
jgi:hypothetical protein